MTQENTKIMMTWIHFFATAVKVFLKNHPQVLTIGHKICEAGHSTIQAFETYSAQTARLPHNSSARTVPKETIQQRLLFEQKKPKVLKYKKHISDDWNEENVIERKTTRSGIAEVLFQVPDPEVTKGAEALTQATK